MDAKFDIFAGGLREVPERNSGGGTGGVEYTAGEGIDISEDNVISVNYEWSGGIVDEMTGAYLENTVYDNIQTYSGEAFSDTLEERDYITCTSPLVSININYRMGGGFGEAVIRFKMAATSTADPFAVLPSIEWVGGTPEIELGKSYIISIKDGSASGNIDEIFFWVRS